VGYVVWHVVTVAHAAHHPDRFGAVLRVLTDPALDAFLILALAYHASNGVRVVLFDLGIERMRGRAAFWAFAAAAALAAAAGIARGVFHAL